MACGRVAALAVAMWGLLAAIATAAAAPGGLGPAKEIPAIPNAWTRYAVPPEPLSPRLLWSVREIHVACETQVKVCNRSVWGRVSMDEDSFASSPETKGQTQAVGKCRVLMPRQAARIPVWPGSTEVLSFRSARDAARCRVEATTEERPDLLWWALAAAAAFLLAGPLVAHQLPRVALEAAALACCGALVVLAMVLRSAAVPRNLVIFTTATTLGLWPLIRWLTGSLFPSFDTLHAALWTFAETPWGGTVLSAYLAACLGAAYYFDPADDRREVSLYCFDPADDSGGGRKIKDLMRWAIRGIAAAVIAFSIQDPRASTATLVCLASTSLLSHYAKLAPLLQAASAPANAALRLASSAATLLFALPIAPTGTPGHHPTTGAPARHSRLPSEPGIMSPLSTAAPSPYAVPSRLVSGTEGRVSDLWRVGEGVGGRVSDVGGRRMGEGVGGRVSDVGGRRMGDGVGRVSEAGERSGVRRVDNLQGQDNGLRRREGFRGEDRDTAGVQAPRQAVGSVVKGEGHAGVQVPRQAVGSAVKGEGRGGVRGRVSAARGGAWAGLQEEAESLDEEGEGRGVARQACALVLSGKCINPLTDKVIKIGGKVYDSLVENGYRLDVRTGSMEAP